MRRIFRERGIDPKGLVLPIEECRLFSDLREATLDPEKLIPYIHRAEEALKADIPSLALSDYRSFSVTGNRSVFDQKFLRRRYMAIDLAMAEYVEKKGRFTEKLCDVVWAILEESTWVLHAHTGVSPERPGTDVPEVYRPDQLHGIDLRSAATAAVLAMICVYAGEAMSGVSPILVRRLRYEVADRSIRPFLQATFGWSGETGQKVNNWCTFIVGCILYTAAVLEKDTFIRERVVERSIRFLDNFIACCPEDGGCDEGAGYWGGAAGSLFDCLELIYDMTGGRIDLFDDPLVKALGEYQAAVYIGGDRFANFSDCPALVVPNGELTYRYGMRVGSDAMITFGNACRYHRRIPDGMHLFHVYRTLKDMTLPFPAGEPQPLLLPTAVWYKDLKVMVCRENPMGTGLYLAIKGGTNGESHNHNDIGSFLVFSGETPVLIDAGSGGYSKKTFSALRYTVWNMQSEHHNLPVIGGKGQKAGIAYTSRDEHFDEEGHACRMELRDAYPREVGIRSFVREASLRDGAVTVTDRLFLEREETVQFRFLTTQNPTEKEPGVITLPGGRVLRFDPSLTAEIAEIDPIDMDCLRLYGTKLLWQIRLSATLKEGEYTFHIS